MATGNRRPVDLGDLQRTTPVARNFGRARGQPVDRVYIEQFLQSNAKDIRGRVVEIGSDEFTQRLGGDRVRKVDILDYSTSNRRANIIADLANGSSLQANVYDCFICPQTLQFVFDIREAVRTIHRVLKPGGVALVTVPGISQIARDHMDREGDFWRFTSRAAKRLFATAFPARRVNVRAYGNVLAATALLHGLATEELRPADLAREDPDYEVIVAMRAVKG